jgi:hypothetical protein
MTFPGDGDGSLEELLRNALRGEADHISPAGDGLSRIQQRVTSRRRRQWWVRPMLALGSVTVVAAAGVGAYVATSHPTQNDSLLTGKQPQIVPSASQTAITPSPTTSRTTPAAPAFPAAAFYPFTSAAAELSWEAQGGPATEPWATDPVAAAQHFVTAYVLADQVTAVMGKRVRGASATVTLGRTLSDGSSQHPVKVTTVHLQKFGRAWLVLGADDPNGDLRVTSPASGARITTPVTVSGPSYGVDEAVEVDVRAIGEPFLTAAHGTASFGNGSAPWSTTVAFTPPADPRGAVVVIENSPADGGPGRITVTGVTFASEATGYPAYYYAEKNGRIAKFSARDGAALTYLTPARSLADKDPQLVGADIYYVHTDADCRNSIWVVPAAGGKPHPAGGLTGWASQPGYEINRFAVHDSGLALLYETVCGPGVTSQAKVALEHVVNGTVTSEDTTDWPSIPPGIVNDMSWEPDRQHVDFVLRTGTRNDVRRFDTARMSDAPTLVCQGYDLTSGEPWATQIDANGYLWFATRTGSSMQVVRCIGSTPRVMFTVAGNRQPSDLAVAGSGGAVLLSDTGGSVWRWTERDGPVKLTPKQPTSRLTW